MKRDLFDLSIPDGGAYTDLLVKRPDYQRLVTFAENKKEPFYSWFYYKEGFARELVWKLLDEMGVPEGGTVFDPFCGTGNTLLACMQRGYNSIGCEILPLGAFVSNTKVQQDYDVEKLADEIRKINSFKFGETSLKWVDPGFIDINRAFSRYARNDLLFFKEKIIRVEDEKIRNFMMLALLSIVLQASNAKRDGGVIRIVKKKHLAPVRYLFKNKLKRMLHDVKKMQHHDCFSKAYLGDARSFQPDEKVDACITSPPYLNYIDYTKLYGLELALLLDRDEISQLRKMSLRSHIGAESRGKTVDSELLRQTLENINDPMTKSPEIVGDYFADMKQVMQCVHGSLKKGGKFALVVGNACLPGTTIDVDLILAELGQKMGFKAREILVANVRWCDVHGIKKERPARESIVVLEK